MRVSEEYLAILPEIPTPETREGALQAVVLEPFHVEPRISGPPAHSGVFSSVQLCTPTSWHKTGLIPLLDWKANSHKSGFARIKGGRLRCQVHVRPRKPVENKVKPLLSLSSLLTRCGIWLRFAGEGHLPSGRAGDGLRPSLGPHTPSRRSQDGGAHLRRAHLARLGRSWKWKSMILVAFSRSSMILNDFHVILSDFR